MRFCSASPSCSARQLRALDVAPDSSGDAALHPDRLYVHFSIQRTEFDEVYDQFVALGVPVKPDRDQAWRDFVGWRVNYDAVLLALAALTQSVALAQPAVDTHKRSCLDQAG